MKPSRKRARIAFFSAAASFTIQQSQAASLPDLMRSVPAPPKDVPTALSWIKDGTIVAPEYTQFKQAIDAERAAIAALNGGTLPPLGAAVNPNIADTPDVLSAIRGYTGYLAANSGPKEPAAALAERTRWVQGAMGGQQSSLTKRMTPCPLPCTNPAAVAQNQPILDKKTRLAAEELQMWNALFTDWQKTRAAPLNLAQTQIAATGEGANATTPEGKRAVAEYRVAMLKEIDVTLSITELAIKRAEAVEKSRSGVVAPDAYSGATKAKAKAP